MLPFLKDKKEAGMSTKPELDKIDRKPDEEEDEDHDVVDSLEGAMQELHSALNAKDYSGAAEIFRSAFELMDSEPHEEGEHI